MCGLKFLWFYKIVYDIIYDIGYNIDCPYHMIFINLKISMISQFCLWYHMQYHIYDIIHMILHMITYNIPWYESDIIKKLWYHRSSRFQMERVVGSCPAPAPAPARLGRTLASATAPARWEPVPVLARQDPTPARPGPWYGDLSLPCQATRHANKASYEEIIMILAALMNAEVYMRKPLDM